MMINGVNHPDFPCPSCGHTTCPCCECHGKAAAICAKEVKDEPEILSPPIHNYIIESDESQEENEVKCIEIYIPKSGIEELKKLVQWVTDVDAETYGHTVTAEVGWDHAQDYPGLYWLQCILDDCDRDI